MARVVAALLLGLVLSGCGGSPEAPPKPTRSTTPSPSVATPTVPELPEAAKANTKDGAEAFVRYYVDLINHTQQTGDVDALQRSSMPDCRSCNRVITRAQEIYGDGGQIRGGLWSVRAIEVTDPEMAPGAAPIKSATLDIRSTAQTVVQPGKDDLTFPAGTVRYILALKWNEARWRIAAWSGV